MLFFAVFFVSLPLQATIEALWQDAGAMAGPRGAGAAATTLPDGNVLITGGAGPDGPLSRVEIYVDGAFIEAPPMNIARSEHTAVRLSDGRILVTGGKTVDGQPTWSAEAYDPRTNSWTEVGDMAQARYGHTATMLWNRQVLVAGGVSVAGVTDTLELFNPRSNKFESVATVLSSPRAHHADAGLVDNLGRKSRVLLIGGVDGQSTLSSIDEFDLETMQVKAGPELSVPRSRHSATRLLNGDVFIAGGNNGQTDLASAEVYQASSGQLVRAKGSLSLPRSGHSAVLLPDNNSVLIVGGTSGGQAVAKTEVYRPWISNARLLNRLKFWQSAFTAAPLLSQPGAIAAASIPARAEAVIFGIGEPSAAERFIYPRISADRRPYKAGETVQLRGAGWNAGDTVQLRLHEEPQIHADRSIEAVVGADGTFSAELTVESHDTGTTLYVTATSGDSQAQTGLVTEAGASTKEPEAQRLMSQTDQVEPCPTCPAECQPVLGVCPPVTSNTCPPSQTGDPCCPSAACTSQLRCPDGPGSAGEACLNEVCTTVGGVTTCVAIECGDACSTDICNPLGFCAVDASGCIGCIGCQECVVPENEVVGQCQPDPTACGFCQTCNPQTGECVADPTKAGLSCDPNNPCFTCNSQGACAPNAGAPCDIDDSRCTADACDASGVCQPGQQVTCPQTDVCKVVSCDPVSGECTNTTNAPDGTPCEFDSNPCTVDRCNGGTCQQGTVPAEQCNGVDDDCDGQVDEGFNTGKMTGGGQVFPTINGNKQKISFGFNAKGTVGGKDKGEFNYINHTTRVKIHGEVIKIISACDCELKFVVRDKKTGCKYEVTVVDNDEPNQGKDLFSIKPLSPPPCPQENFGPQPVERGNIQCHKFKDRDEDDDDHGDDDDDDDDD